MFCFNFICLLFLIEKSFKSNIRLAGYPANDTGYPAGYRIYKKPDPVQPSFFLNHRYIGMPKKVKILAISEDLLVLNLAKSVLYPFSNCMYIYICTCTFPPDVASGVTLS